MANYITIEDVTGESISKVRQTLKFQTGNFVWRIKFNIPLNPSSVTNKTCFITTSSGQPLATNVSYNAELKTIEISPQFAYARNESYLLHITTNVSSVQGQTLPQQITLRFKI